MRPEAVEIVFMRCTDVGSLLIASVHHLGWRFATGAPQFSEGIYSNLSFQAIAGTA